MTSGRRIGRRGVLGLGVAGVVSCSPARPTGSTPTTSSTGRAGPGPSPSSSSSGFAGSTGSATPATAGPTGAPTTAPTDGPGTSAGNLAPARDEIIGRYQGRTAGQWGLEVDGVVLHSEGTSAVVTFDACGGPKGSGYDEELIGLLRQLQVPATLFLNLRWIDANPKVAAELAADPLFELANHGTQHRPLSVDGAEAYGIGGTGSVAEVYDEVMGGYERLLQLTGAPPLWFRSGTAHVDDVSVEIVADLGQRVVNFNVNVDAGATFTPNQVERAMLEAGPGSICIVHFNRPGSGTAAGMATALPRLLDDGLTFARLRDVLPPS